MQNGKQGPLFQIENWSEARQCDWLAMLFNIFTIIEDVHFADDLVMVSNTHQHIQEKKSRLTTYAQ